MPQIAPNVWKVAVSFFWWREYLDGRIEQEFNLETGQIRPWGSKTPDGLKRAGWLPITQDLAHKMRAFGEFGAPSPAPTMLIDLKPGDELQIFKECTVYNVSYVCKACGCIVRESEKPKSCPNCGAAPTWKCDTCGKLPDINECPDCKRECRRIDPIKAEPIPWEDVIYFLGIKGKFMQKFNSRQSIIS
jgi:predicted RNA-binding Zn-ribbon protein involved in translation (DUF1610 family)